MISLLLNLVLLVAIVAGAAYGSYRFLLNPHQKAQILLLLGDQQDAKDKLIEGLDSKDPQTVVRVIRSIVDLKEKRAVAKLIGLLRSPDGEVKLAAVEALGTFQDNRSISPIAEMRFEKDRALKMSVIWALSKHDSKVVAPMLVDMIADKDEMMYMTVCDLLPDMGVSVVPLLEKLLADTDQKSEKYIDITTRVISILKAIDDKSCAGILIALLKSQSRAIREQAANTLGEMYAVQALPALKELLADESIYIQEAAQKAIEMIENSDSINDGVIQKSKEKKLIQNSIAKFREIKKVKSKKFSIDAVYRLIKIGKPAVPDLIDALSDKDSDVKQYSIMALGLIRDPEAIKPIEKMLKSPKPEIAQEAAIALEKLKERRSEP